jgi:hypothetical protein
MSSGITPRQRVLTSLSWPFGIAWTAWHYLWRILPVYRSESEGTRAADGPPELGPGIGRERLLEPQDGFGPLFHRTYQAAVADPELGPAELIDRVAGDPNVVAPSRLARFRKTVGTDGEMAVGDEFIVHMPGPWDGPVRVVDRRPDGFRFATLDGHLEAGQIEWRAWQNGHLNFAVESWARSGDRLSALMHDRLRMAKEVQLYMWTSILERVAGECRGKLVDGVRVETRRVDPEEFD